jgi:ribonuclease D
MLINTNDDLCRLCDGLKSHSFIALDTEFMRERTYYPKLCLIQIVGEGVEEPAAIDPLAEGLDLAPLYELLFDEKITKVFHAARQDLEIFYNLTGKIPSPLADSQVMGMVCGYGDAVSYEALVSKLAKGTIDKTSRFTDWSLRPLTDKQLSYALDDVRYLRVVYEKLKKQINGREHWLDEEMAVLQSHDTYKMNPDTAWKRLKARIDKPKLFTLLVDLAAWREREAQRLDVPRNRVLRDETLLEIVYHAPEDASALGRVRGFSADMAKGRMGQDVLRVLAHAATRTPDPLPDDFRKKPPAYNTGALADMLRVLLKCVAEGEGIAPKLLANSSDLDAIAASDTADVSALKGWRFDIFGKKALELKHGKLAIRMNGKHIEFFGV